jgi:hypothetical protein
MKAIVTGMIATYPVGGVAWDYGQYALGLERLGFEVYYLEDTGLDAYDPEKREYGTDGSCGPGFLEASLAALSPTLATRWHLRASDGTTRGVARADFADVLAEAALFVNVSGSALVRDEYLACRNKTLIDTDPGWNHFRNYPRWDAQPRWLGTHGWRSHDHFFTYAERMGAPDCALPSLGVEWRPTRPPVVADLWSPEPPGERWTTVMTWRNFPETIEHRGRRYGAKELEFDKIEALPARAAAALEVAVGGSGPPSERWRSLGWSVIDSHSVSGTPADYRRYVESSRGELSVAKNVYVATGSGWFSSRTVCYLAAGRPAVIQDTGWSAVIPSGDGVVPFRDLDEAAAGVARVEADYARHQAAARELAREHFGAERVLGDMLGRVGV